MDDKYIKEYEEELLALFAGNKIGDPVGYISYAAARTINENSVELSWYANAHTRFHEVVISLPKDQFVACIGSSSIDERPHIFVKSSWLANLHLRYFSVFGLIDAIGVKVALEQGLVTRDRLIKLRDQIDIISKKHPDFSFITFGDSVLIKSNWSVGYFVTGQKYTYNPETLVSLIKEFRTIYKDILDLNIYAILTQGINEYYDDPLLHISPSNNHISLNSLGIPFSQLLSIDTHARKAVRDNLHGPAELYMDKSFYFSLNFKHGFDKHSCEHNTYQDKMSREPAKYFISSLADVLDNLK